MSQARDLSRTRNGLAKAKRGKGPTGKLLCRCGCGREPQGRRTSFFDDDCAHKFNLSADPRYIAQHLLKRDGGICAVCGIDCIELYKRLFAEGHGNKTIRYCWQSQEHLAFVAKLKLYRITWHEYMDRSRLWDADHIRPVMEGGGLCGLENYQTLCIACHKTKTADMRKAHAKPPPEPKAADLSQLQLFAEAL